jgi:hypothetical protein
MKAKQLTIAFICPLLIHRLYGLPQSMKAKFEAI